MKDVMKKVVILDNLASPYVHQAIIVMRDYDPKLESLAVMEAERIVNAYLDNMKTEKIRPRKRRAAHKRYPALIFFGAAALAAAIAVVRLIC